MQKLLLTLFLVFTFVQISNGQITVSTSDFADLTPLQVTIGGSVTGSGIIERGVVYSTKNSTPSIGGEGVTKLQMGSGEGTFSDQLTGLTGVTKYFYRAYAINGSETSYGETKTFLVKDSRIRGLDYDNWDLVDGMTINGGSLPDMAGHGVTVFDNKIYVVGRYNWSSEVLVFDGENWTYGPSLPSARRNTNVIEFEGHLYKFFGTNANTASISSRIIRLEGSNWVQRLSGLSRPTVTTGLATLHDNIYILGGFSSGNREWVRTYEASSNTYTDLTASEPMPFVQSVAHGAVTYDDKVYVIGQNGNRVYSYSGTGTSWEREVDLPATLTWPTAFIFENRIHVVGGTSGTTTNEHYSWIPGESSWTVEPEFPLNLGRIGGGVLGEQLYIVGGSINGNTGSTAWRNHVYRFPALTSGVSPESGDVSGDDMITITGTFLTNGIPGDITSVTLAGVEADEIISVSQDSEGNSEIVVRSAPSSTALLGDVEVISSTYGTITQINAFTYTAPISVTGSTDADGDFSTIKDSFDAINNAASQSGNDIVITVNENITEIDDAVLNDGDWNSVLVQVNTGIILQIDESISLPAGAVLSISDGAALINNGTIDIQSGAFFNNQGSSDPSITFHRDMVGTEGWRYLTAPVSTTLSNLLANIWTQGADGAKSEFGLPNVYRWGNVEGNDRGDWVEVENLDESVAEGEGFLVFVYADDNFDGTSNPFPKPLTVTGSEFAAGATVTTNSEDNEGWSLLGNPFGTAISFDELQNGTGITGTVYVWSPDDDGETDETDFDSGSWKTYNVSGNGDLTGGLIAPFQGFFVENDGAAGVNLFFNNAIKSTNISDTEFLFKQASQQHIRMELAGNGLRNSAWLSFNSDGSLSERTTGDAWQLEPMSTDYALLAANKPGVGLMDIGHFPVSSELQIPLVATATRPGSYTLTVSDAAMNGLYLHDLHTGHSMPIEQGTAYEFHLNTTAKTPADPFARLASALVMQKQQDEARFLITTSAEHSPGGTELPGEVHLKQNYPNPFNPTTIIAYELPQQSHVHLQVFDIAGRQVAELVNEQVQAGRHSVQFDASTLSSGMYMYRLQAGSVMQTRKLTVIK